jgi:hypothetical protein
MSGHHLACPCPDCAAGRIPGQGSLFGLPQQTVQARAPNPLPPFVRESETSREAAIAIAPNASAIREQVYAFIAKAGSLGTTDEEIQERMALAPNTARPRRVELVTAGRVRDSGRRRNTRSGRQAVVWVAVGVGDGTAHGG